MNRLIVILGPTAVGKSDLALKVAERFGCEIVSGDSMCVYKGMDIGTAKPSISDRQRIPHHLIDIREPGEEFSAADFQILAGEAIKTINHRGKIPLLVGGTGLYVQSLLEGYQFSPTPKTGLRKTLATTAADSGQTADLYKDLIRLDPETASYLHPHDRKRILRSLEIVLTEQAPLSRRKLTDQPRLLFDCIVLGLSLDRPELYHRIDSRVDKMISAGLVDEVRALLTNSLKSSSTALQAIGYKELAGYLQGAVSLETAISMIKQASRRYAKRQLTWFRRMPYIHWIQQGIEPSKQDTAFISTVKLVAENFSIK